MSDVSSKTATFEMKNILKHTFVYLKWHRIDKC